jgi:hypothetical protein
MTLVQRTHGRYDGTCNALLSPFAHVLAQGGDRPDDFWRHLLISMVPGNVVNYPILTIAARIELCSEALMIPWGDIDDEPA